MSLCHHHHNQNRHRSRPTTTITIIIVRTTGRQQYDCVVQQALDHKLSYLLRAKHPDPNNPVRSAIALYNIRKIFLPEPQSGSHATPLHILTVEFAIGIGSGLLWAKAAVLCLCPENDVLHLTVNWAKAQCAIIHLLSLMFRVVG